MNAKQFFDKVCEMREAQKAYARTLDPNAQNIKIALETAIDNEIERVDRVLREQQEKVERFEARQTNLNL